MCKWISVEEKSIPRNTNVLVLTDDGECLVTWFDDVIQEWMKGCVIGDVTSITHWMPIPELKNEEIK